MSPWLPSPLAAGPAPAPPTAPLALLGVVALIALLARTRGASPLFVTLLLGGLGSLSPRVAHLFETWPPVWPLETLLLVALPPLLFGPAVRLGRQPAPPGLPAALGRQLLTAALLTAAAHGLLAPALGLTGWAAWRAALLLAAMLLPTEPAGLADARTAAEAVAGAGLGPTLLLLGLALPATTPPAGPAAIGALLWSLGAATLVGLAGGELAARAARTRPDPVAAAAGTVLLAGGAWLAAGALQASGAWAVVVAGYWLGRQAPGGVGLARIVAGWAVPAAGLGVAAVVVAGARLPLGELPRHLGALLGLWFAGRLGRVLGDQLVHRRGAPVSWNWPDLVAGGLPGAVTLVLALGLIGTGATGLPAAAAQTLGTIAYGVALLSWLGRAVALRLGPGAPGPGSADPAGVAAGRTLVLGATLAALPDLRARGALDETAATALESALRKAHAEAAHQRATLGDAAAEAARARAALLAVQREALAEAWQSGLLSETATAELDRQLAAGPLGLPADPNELTGEG